MMRLFLKLESNQEKEPKRLLQTIRL